MFHKPLLAGALAAVLLVTALAASNLAAAAEPLSQSAPQAKGVLIVTGEDYPGHKWQETAPALKKQLEADGRLRVDVLDDLKQLGSYRLDDYAVVVLHFKNYDPAVPGRAGYENLEAYVNEGGGLVLVHFACGAFEEFKGDFEKMAGRVWFGQKPPPGRRQHDRRGPFEVHVVKRDHPITKGLDDFTTTDELYTCLEGEVPITTLATSTSQNDGKDYPMAFVLSFGAGRVFHCPLGHDVPAFEAPGAGELLRRGTAWAAGLEPCP